MKKNQIRKDKLPFFQWLAEFEKTRKAKFSTTKKKKAIVGTIPTSTSIGLVIIRPLAGSIISIYTMIIFLAQQDLRIIFRESLQLADILFRYGRDIITQIGNETMAQSFTDVQLHSFLYILGSIILMIPAVKYNLIDLLNTSYMSNINRELLTQTIENIVELERLARSCYRVIEGRLDILIQDTNLIPVLYEDVYSDYLHYLSTIDLA